MYSENTTSEYEMSRNNLYQIKNHHHIISFYTLDILTCLLKCKHMCVQYEHSRINCQIQLLRFSALKYNLTALSNAKNHYLFPKQLQTLLLVAAKWRQ